MFKTLYVNIYLKLHCTISSWGCSNFIWESVSIESSIYSYTLCSLTHFFTHLQDGEQKPQRTPVLLTLSEEREGIYFSIYPPEWWTLCKPTWHVLSIKPRAQCLKQADQTVVKTALLPLAKKKSWCRLLGMSLPVLLCNGLKAKLFCQHHLSCQQLKEKWDGENVFFCLGLTGILLIPFWKQSRGLNIFTKIIWSRI